MGKYMDKFINPKPLHDIVYAGKDDNISLFKTKIPLIAGYFVSVSNQYQFLTNSRVILAVFAGDVSCRNLNSLNIPYFDNKRYLPGAVIEYFSNIT